VFCRHLTGYSVKVWQHYGEFRLGLPRFDGTSDQIPKDLTVADDVYLLPGAKLPMPRALRVYAGDENWMEAKDLYARRSLRKGVHFVPYCWDYQEGYCSMTALVRQFKLKPKEAALVRPAFRLVRKKYEDYLLYPIPKKPSKEAPIL
jgi:hypothetical protein